MPYDEHSVFLAELDVTIRRLEVIRFWACMHGVPLQNIFRADGIELGFDEFRFPGIIPIELGSGEGRADEKIIF